MIKQWIQSKGKTKMEAKKQNKKTLILSFEETLFPEINILY